MTNISPDSLKRWASPRLVGAECFVMICEPIHALLGDSPIVSINLCIAKNGERLPKFGLSDVSAKKLYKKAAELKCRLDQLPMVREHKWDKVDLNYWDDLILDNNFAVHITFYRCGPSHVEIIFTYNSVNSSLYKYRTVTDNDEAYFVIFTPKHEFSCGRMSLLSNYELLKEIGDLIQKKSVEVKFVPSECISCYSNITEAVFLPCGHTSFCSVCIEEYRNMYCPICKQEIYDYVIRNMAANFCTVCPVQYNCTQVNAMLLPCRCVVGCIEKTKIVVRPGEHCPNCFEEVKKIQQIYY